MKGARGYEKAYQCDDGDVHVDLPYVHALLRRSFRCTLRFDRKHRLNLGGITFVYDREASSEPPG